MKCWIRIPISIKSQIQVLQRLKIEHWKVCGPVVANSHQADEEQDLDLIQESEPDRIKMKSFRNLIILMRIRYPDYDNG
jgi:hypothetical protein